MNTDKVWVVLLVLVLILVGSNILMLAAARGFRGMKMPFMKQFGDATKPWKKEDEGWKELRERVHDLNQNHQDDDRAP